MVPELRDLGYEGRLMEMGLLALQGRRERGDFIMMFKIVKRKEMIDRTDLVMMITNETRNRRGHSRKIGKVDAQGMSKSSAFLTEQWMCGMDWLKRLLRLTVCIHLR